MEVRSVRKPSTQRVLFLIVAFLLQLALLLVVTMRFQRYSTAFHFTSIGVSVVVVVSILNSRSNPAFKIAWIVPIMLLPVFGGLFYVFFGRSRMNRRSRDMMRYVDWSTRRHLPTQDGVIAELRQHDPHAAVQAAYIQDYALFPPYRQARTEYLGQGEHKYARLREAMESAERFIFLEYFIIEEGLMWDSLLEIMRSKAAEGVDVRIIYDDLGCLLTLPKDYPAYLESMGIRAAVFNPLVPVLSFIHNNRDHRKIAIIDGHTGFTGGINLADNYINEKEKYGHWKDAAILVSGPAVRNMTVMFLTMWNYLRQTDEDVSSYLTCDERDNERLRPMGYVQPFADSPLDQEPVGQTVYLNLIGKATRYVYITTPYLVIDYEMTNALTAAAKGGVDVRIITPYHADKGFVQAVTRSNYLPLIEAGVKVYEYTPGFIHSKTFLVDDRYAVVGTINMDYRSLFLHFECGVWLYGTESIAKIREDFLETQAMSTPANPADYLDLPWHRSMRSAMLRLFAPLM